MILETFYIQEASSALKKPPGIRGKPSLVALTHLALPQDDLDE